MLVVLFIFGALVGACVGSYLGACAYRLPRGISIARGRSLCPNCGVTIPARCNVPLAGWLLLRGQARCCGASLSRRYLVLEGAAALAGGILLVVAPALWLAAITAGVVYPLVLQQARIWRPA